MKAYLWKTDRLISPFMDPVGESMICNLPLREHQRRTLEAHGVELAESPDPLAIPDPEYLLIRDDLFFTAVALNRFLAKAVPLGKSCACALESGPFTDFTGFIQDLRADQDPETGKPVRVYGLYYCREPLGDSAAAKSLPPLRIEAEQKAFPIQPGDFLPSSVEVKFNPAFTDALLFHVCHWVHLWLLNLLALGDQLLRTFTGSKVRMALRALSAFSLNKHKIAARFVVKGKGCDIHPTATVQASILGDKVTIGPYSIVQGCILGDGVKINEQSITIASIFGAGTSTCPRGWSKLCITYPNTSSGRMHACLIGRNVFMASLAYFFDVKLQGTIKLAHDGKMVDTGMNFLGGCVGHNAIVGPDCWIASGREIPNGAMVMKNPGEVLSSIPPDFPAREPGVVWNGTLVPVRQLAALRKQEEAPAPAELPAASKSRE
jgi:carbonic anhydrase/acetyltransferase-like protein (isoleucine patch superfamily)